MQTNFFNLIAKMDINSKLILAITKANESQIVASILVQNDGCGDKAKNIIPPLNLKGTADELDAGFFEHIKAPLQTASGLMVDMETFMKQLEEAKKQSAMEKEKSDKEKKEKEAKEKKCKDAFPKAEELEKEGNYKGAWSALPKASEYPDYAENIRKKQDEYERHFTHNLFSEEKTPTITFNPQP
ncbi:PRTRC system protein E [Chryseobacterium indologenes]|uniref:PRTRC system protein E n=1 Tax=Chryseobacterium indologenes TaxID=253 RepID=UPI000F516B1B|nr:PRTRC system protein E [Chryseobacterium indologenes]AYY84553.1 PRTRC system protein E [Chryseobacterium indologenes]